MATRGAARKSLPELTDDRRFGRTVIDDVAEPGQRREAFDIARSMPRGTGSLIVRQAAGQFAQIELVGHWCVTVVHHRRMTKTSTRRRRKCRR